MSIQDVLKKSFLNQFNSDLSTTSIVGTLILTALIGTYIFVIYRAVCRKAFYSKSFAISLPVISMITASIIISIQSSVVISLGMVGALSIVRFRTAVKDPMDTAYMFWALTMGILLGAELYVIAIVVALGISVILFGLLLPRLYLTSFGSELNGLDSTIKQIFSCLTLLEAGVGLASQQAYYLPVAVGDRKAINGIFSATHHYYRRTGIVYLLVTVVFALLYPLCINTVLSYGTVSLIVVFYGIPGIVSYLVQGKYRSFMEVEGKNYVITYITTATMAAGNLLRMLALLFTRSILLVQMTYCVPSVFQVLVLTAYMRKNYPWLNAHDTPNLEALAQRGSVLVHQLTSIVFNNTDTILISSLCGLASASVYTIYMLFFSNIEKLFYSIVNSISFRLGQLFYVEPEKFKRLYRLYDALYLSAAFALFTTVAVFLMPIIALYTSGVTDAEYLDTRLLVLFTAVELLSSAKQPSGMLLNISGRFEETRQQALIEMGINLLVSVMSVLRFGIAGCLFGTLAAHLYRYTALILFTRTKVLGESPVGDFVRLGVNGLLCFVLLYLLGFDRCYGGGYLMVCLKGALFGLWVLPLFLVVNAVLDWRNVDTLRGLLHTLTIKKGATEEKHDAE